MKDYLNKTIQFVDESFGVKKPHFERTVYWLLQLKPEADLALQVAAYGHDVERAFKPKETDARHFLIYPSVEALQKHEDDSADIMYDFLIKEGADEEMAGKVKTLISKHEVGGIDDQNLLKDADSISYLEVNAPRNLEWFGEVPPEEYREKFEFMYGRITSKKAKELAKPFYDKAYELLQEKIDEAGKN